MKSSDIVHGGGWMKRKFIGRPKSRFFAFLSVIWLAVSLCASAPFWLDAWPPTFSGVEWLCGLLILPEPAFIVLAIVFAVTEKPREMTEHIPNPDYDIRKLY